MLNLAVSAFFCLFIKLLKLIINFIRKLFHTLDLSYITYFRLQLTRMTPSSLPH